MDLVSILVVVALAVAGVAAFLILRRKPEALPTSTEAAPKTTPQLPTESERPAATTSTPSETTSTEHIAPEPEPAPTDETSAAASTQTESATTDAPAPTASVAIAQPAQVSPSESEPVKHTSIAPPPDDVALLRRGLGATRGGIIAKLRRLFGRTETIDPSVLEEIEEILLTADVGVHTTNRILNSLREGVAAGRITGESGVWDALRAEAIAILDGGRAPAMAPTPHVILVVGVNGVGKTTTIGKLASKLVAEGKKVLLVAGDTYRAAAVIQLEVWAKRVGCEIAKGRDRADPSSVMFDALKKAQESGVDVVLCDTAGRLQTKAPLMEELAKIGRTIEKAIGRGADETLLVLDATTGQNAISQAETFKEACNVSGVVLTKLDGTAKGGVVLGIVDAHRVPVRYVGIGERVEDLRVFDTRAFVDALFDKSDEDVSE